MLERQISHLTRLVDDLLDVSRLTRGKVDLVRHRFEARTAIDRAVDMARPLVEENGHALYVGVPDTGLPIDGDQDRIVQVLVNLLTNAARYTPPGGHLALTSECVDGRVEITCEDDGPGVPAEQVPTIFEPFIQGPRSIARQQGGLGLGLTLARSLTELHGGGLRYEPVVPHGSRFVVSLPLAADVAIDESSIGVLRNGRDTATRAAGGRQRRWPGHDAAGARNEGPRGAVGRQRLRRRGGCGGISAGGRGA